METKAEIYCGGIKPASSGGDAKVVELNLWPKAGPQSVRLKVSQLHDTFWRDVPPRWEDFLELATYVYSGDQAVARSADDSTTMGGKWRRWLHYHIPVREPDFWNSAEVKTALRQTLEFLSDDYYDFTFTASHHAPDVQQFLEIGAAGGKFTQPERVGLFSGGLDSVAGAVQEIVGERHPYLLVNHRSTGKFSDRYKKLVQQLASKAQPVPVGQLRVGIDKDSHLTKDYTQRARSFLFAAMGMTVASMLGLDELTCFENGVVSLNLPVCAQIVGAKATRTTHPRVIRGLERLATLVAGGKIFHIRTPFLWDTKGEVIGRILKQDCGELIGLSRSCAETILRSNLKPHCGVCSQCIDRRMAGIASGAESFDPVSGYAVDVFTESLPKAVDKIMAAEFVQRALESGKYHNAVEFIGDYPETLLALPHMEGTRSHLADRVMKLYQRHGAEVEKAFDVMQVVHGKALRRRTLPEDCLLRIILDPASVTVLPAEGSPPPKRVEESEVVEDESEPEKRKTIGRLSYFPSFNEVWLDDDEHFDLRERAQAKACLQYLVDAKAFDPDTARHLTDEIDPYVREQCKIEPLPDYSEFRIHHYFNPTTGKYAELCRALIKPAGRNRRFYLKVF